MPFVSVSRSTALVLVSALLAILVLAGGRLARTGTASAPEIVAPLEPVSLPVRVVPGARGSRRPCGGRGSASRALPPAGGRSGRGRGSAGGRQHASRGARRAQPRRTARRRHPGSRAGSRESGGHRPFGRRGCHRSRRGGRGARSEGEPRDGDGRRARRAPRGGAGHRAEDPRLPRRARTVQIGRRAGRRTLESARPVSSSCATS